MSAEAYGCGVDIGYGQVKAAGGGFSRAGRFWDDGREIILPAGAAIASAMPKNGLTNGPDLKGGEEVLIDGESWVAGVDQVYIQRGSRQTHEDYSSTREYKALYLAALSKLGFERINLLVTGLPVKQAFGPKGEALKQKLAKDLTGEFFINARTRVVVDRVAVVAQPLGTFMDVALTSEESSLMKNDMDKVLVFDPGFYSVDWVLMMGQSVLNERSHSSTDATSRILERAARAITSQTQVDVSRDQLDAALRRGMTHLNLGRNSRFDYKSVIVDEGRSIAREVIGEVKSTLRDAGTIGRVIVTGGGGWLYEQTIREEFANAEVLTPSDPVLSNARGYYELARRALSKRSVA